MDMGQAMPLLGAFLLGAVLAAAAVFGGLWRRIQRDHDRVHHVEQARQQAAVQLTQARKQIEQLQRENHELRLAVRPAPRPAPAPEAPVDAAEAARRYVEARLQQEAEPEAFPQTVILRRPPA